MKFHVGFAKPSEVRGEAADQLAQDGGHRP
jgi:hypothetical protein